MFNPFRKPVDAPKTPDMAMSHDELLVRLFSLEEAKKHLLNVVPPPAVTPEQVLSDSAALEHMMGQKGWSVFEKAVWFKLLTSLRQSLAAETPEKRDAARQMVLAHLSVLHLPYEMRFAADNLKKMREIQKTAV